MKRKIGKRARLLAFLLAAIVMLTSFSFSSVYAEENQASDMVQKETNIDSPGEDTTEEDKEPEKDVEKDLETERQMKQLLKEIGVGFAESDAQANTSSMPRRAKATRAAGDVINTGRIKSNSIGRIDVIDYNDPSWPQLLTWREGLLGNTDTKEPLFCADPMDHFKAGKKTGVDASTIYNKETIQTVVAMMYYYDHYMCKSINSDYEYLMKQCAVWWVLNAVHGWFADGVNIETGNGVKCACGSWISGHKSEYYKKGLVWAWENYKYFTDAKGVIYQGNGQPLSSWSGTYTPKTYTSLTVQKVWDDQNNKYNLRPSSVKINLYRWSNKDSARVLVDSAYATPSNNDWNWKVTWNDLLRTDGDITYEYTAEEAEVSNYSGKMEWDGSYEKGWTGTLTNKLKTYTNEPDRQEEQSAYVDPTRFLDGKEIHKWNQLSQSLKKRYIAEGIKEAKASSKARSGILKDNYDFTEEIEKKVANVYTADLYRMEETAGINTYQRFEYNPLKRFQNHWNHREKNKKLSSENEIQGITDKRSSAAGQESIRKGERYLSKEQEQIKLQIKAGINKESATGKVVADSATATSTATSGAVTAGGSLVVTAGKKAADKFKDYMQERSMASEQAIRNVESKMTEIKNANHEMDSLPSSLKYIGAAVGAVLLSVLAVVVQAVFSFLAVIIGVIIAILVPIIVVVTIISTLIGIIASLMSSTPVIAGGGERIVQIALQEENNPSGAKYWRYVMGSQFVNGDVTPWCACFVSWCANEAGLIDSGIVPKAAAVRAYHRYYAERGRFHYASEGYTPQPGDFIVFGADTHIGIVQYVENGRVVTIEGNTSDAVHSRSYALNSSYVTGYCNPEYPAGTTIEIPEGMGTTHTYMGWRTITSPSSRQYQLREQSGEHYDSEGFGIIDGRYVIACTTLYGQVGDYIDFYRENGDVLHCVIGDIKNQNDAGCNQYGHQNGRCVVEFVVQYSTWYPSHANPGTPNCKPEWNSRVVRAVNLGYNYLQ